MNKNITLEQLTKLVLRIFVVLLHCKVRFLKILRRHEELKFVRLLFFQSYVFKARKLFAKVKEVNVCELMLKVMKL